MSEEPGEYHTGRTARAKPSLTVDALVAQTPANRQGISYETGEPLLERLPQRLHTLADLVLGGQMNAGDVAYAVAALMDWIESAPAESGSSFQLSPLISYWLPACRCCHSASVVS